jgi:N-acetylglutamate synthase-like GNAT family acetyltransferase
MKELKLRRGGESDLPTLQRLLRSHQMETEVDPGEFWLAEVEGSLAGAARLEWEDGLAYLRPIAVEPDWQAQGIGRVLVQEIATGLHQLNVVARGEAIGFYRRLGFAPVDWEQVPERYRQECTACPDLETCRPAPMAWVRNQTGGS